MDNCLFWEYPHDIFEAFKEIYALTYLIESSIFDAYLHTHGLAYEKASVTRNEDGDFVLCPYTDSAELRRELAPLINIYYGRLNRYLSPEVEKYFSRRGSPLNEEHFATSELVQWIWRSAIRNGEKIRENSK